MESLFGLLNVYKRRGITSRDAVNQIQQLVRPNKAGHAGTLDPLAEGVLVICVGAATRLIEYVQRMPKKYCGTFLLGKDSDTQDVDGKVVDFTGASRPARAQLESALPAFVGEIKQTPPAFSALKVAGKRAYDLAREGQLVELKPRKVAVHDMKILSYEYPELVLEVTCGGGTYIRTLGRDLAMAAGSCAVMAALTRTAVGSFHVEDSHRTDDMDLASIDKLLLPAASAVNYLPAIQLNDEELRRIANGLSVDNRFNVNEREIAALDRSNELVALLTPRGQDALGPIRNFRQPPVS